MTSDVKTWIMPKIKLSEAEVKSNEEYMSECIFRWEDMYQRTKFPYEKLPDLKVDKKTYQIYKDEGERFRKYNIRTIGSKGRVLSDVRIKESEIEQFLPRTDNCKDACKTVISNMYDYKISYALMQLAYNAKAEVRQKWLEQKVYTQAKAESLKNGEKLSDLDLSGIKLRDNFVSLYDVNIYNGYNKHLDENVLSAHIPTADGRKIVLKEQPGVSIVMRRKANSSVAQYDTVYRKGNVQLDGDFTFEVYYSRNHFKKFEMTADELNDVYIDYLGSLVSKQAKAVGVDRPKRQLPTREKAVEREMPNCEMQDEAQLQAEI